MSRKFNQASWEDELEDFDEDDIHYYESEEEEERPKIPAKKETSLNQFMNSLVEKKENLVNKKNIPSDIPSSILFDPLATAPSSFASVFISQPSSKCNNVIEQPVGRNPQIFKFDKPSPDDIVLKAQAHSQVGQAKLSSKEISEVSVKVSKLDIKGPAKKEIPRSTGKQNINLVVAGHVDAGKSTLMGHLLYLMKQVDEKTMLKYEKESQSIGKGSFSFAWVLDSTQEERNRGVTINVGMGQFETATKKVTLMDAPGHVDFISNMIAGAERADAALLVIDGNTGEFERGFDSGGQSKEHARLLMGLGVQQMIVAINKLEKVQWSLQRFNIIKERFSDFLQSCGFDLKSVFFIPTSGLEGTNLIERSTISSWYKEKCLLELIDSLQCPKRDLEKPFRFVIHDVSKGNSSSPICMSGLVASGVACANQTVLLVPLNRKVTIKGIESHSQSTKTCEAGDQVTLSVSGIEAEHLRSGDVLCSTDAPVSSSETFEAKIATFDLSIPITLGFSIILHINGSDETAHVSRLLRTLDTETGAVVKENPRLIQKNSAAVVELKLDRKMPLETFEQNRNLGRFSMRTQGKSIASGLITKIN